MATHPTRVYRNGARRALTNARESLMGAASPWQPWLIPLLVLFGLTRPAPLSAEPLKFVARFNGPCYAVTLKDNLACFGIGGAFILADASSPRALQPIGQVMLPANIQSIAINGQYACVAADTAGLHIIDITHPRSPEHVGQHDTGGRAFTVVVADERAYVAAGTAGLIILDVSDPRAPRRIATYPTPKSANGVALHNHHAYVATGSSGVHVLDVTDPAAPKPMAVYDSHGKAFDLAIDGDRAFLANGKSSFQVLDIADPENPKLLGKCRTPGDAYRIALQENRAYVADGGGGLVIIDISQPANPQPVSRYVGGIQRDMARGVAVSGKHVYVAHAAAGLHVIDIANPRAPGEGPLIYTGSRAALDVAVSKNLACVADYWEGLLVFDVSRPDMPLCVSRCQWPGTPSGVALTGMLAIVADRAGMQIVDLSDPRDPKLRGRYDVPDKQPVAVAVAGRFAYLAETPPDTSPDEGGRIEIIDLTDPDTPRPIAALDTAGSASDVAVAGNVAYVAEAEGSVLMLDVSDPAAPTPFARTLVPGPPRALSFAADRLYLAAGSSGLVVLDVTDPLSRSYWPPSLLGTSSRV
jgi:hypothetical protein